MKKPQGSVFKDKFPYWFERELIEKCGISRQRFHKVRGDQWEAVYQKITDQYANKTLSWKNGLHWANTNGYSPKSMNRFRGCYPVDYMTWFYALPNILPENEMAYFLIDRGSFWYLGERFFIFESYIPELIKVLETLNQSAFLGLGSSDYYIVSKKYRWLIGFNHHDIVSFIGDELNMNGLGDIGE